jgi:6-pyruvoyltetrahydropterin/6-carboxytetrahydropterin synthase
MHSITRTHEIACGHRVFGHESKCAHLHGHNYVFEFTCTGELDHLGRVLDFSVVKERLCQWLEDTWDHRMILWVDDPAGRVLLDAGLQFHWVDFNPTAENMAQHLVEVIGPMRLRGTGVRLVKCRVWETGKCSASFEVSPC